jgi:hypothetical protein
MVQARVEKRQAVRQAAEAFERELFGRLSEDQDERERRSRKVPELVRLAR